MPLPSTTMTRRSPRDTEDDEPEPPRTLTEFIGDVRDAARFAEGLRTELTALTDDLDDDIIFRTAQAAFEADVARRGDLKNHIALRRLRQADRTIEQRERAFDFAREKFEFNAADAVLTNLAAIKAIDADRALPHPDKIQAVRLHLFGAPPANLALDATFDVPADEAA